MPYGMTPLYLKTLEALGAAVAQEQIMNDAGVPCRSIVVIASDGADNESRGKTASDVKKVINDLLGTERFIIMGLGLSDGSTNFQQVFANMGIAPNMVLTGANNPKEIRQLCRTVSQSVTRASQGAKGFSQVQTQGLSN